MEIFTIQVENVSVTAVQDILAAYCSNTKKLQILAVEVGANGQTTVGNYPMRIKYLPATVTHGSGGSVVTPNNVNPDGAAASFSARGNDITLATSSGVVAIVSTMFNPINGYYWAAPTPIGDEPKADLSGAWSVSLDGISGTLNISATMWLHEI